MALKILRHALDNYIRRPVYLRALAQGGDRIDLKGKPAEASGKSQMLEIPKKARPVLSLKHRPT